jgi:hypothetical protein
MMALIRGGVDRAYLGRRCFGSAAEDSLSLQAMEMGAELMRRPPRHTELPYFQSVLASCRGAKWYWPVGKAYTLSRCAAWETPRDLGTEADIHSVAESALGRGDAVALMKVHREAGERKSAFDFYRWLMARAGELESPEVRRLAAVCKQNSWAVVLKELNPLWQLIWVLCHGAFSGSGDPLDLTGLDHLLREVEERWAAPQLERVPGWALDGIHTREGSDARFAGNWPGLRNMLAMYEAYGRVDPADDGIVVTADS